MKKQTLFFALLILLLSSCLKENLDKNTLKRAMILQVDAKTFKFEGGKEFSYFGEDTSKIVIPTSFDYNTSSPGIEGRLVVRYMSDTIFNGTTTWQTTSGKLQFPQVMDDAVHFRTLDNNIAKPIDSRFHTIFHDLQGTAIPYDSIWTAVRKLNIVNEYLFTNTKANIGVFLYRPSEGVPSNPGDWKWYLVFKN